MKARQARIWGNATDTPFGTYLHTLPKRVELFVQPLGKLLFCPINASPNELLVQTPTDPLHLKPTFFFFEGGGRGGVKNVEKKTTPPFWGSKIINLSVFFDFEPKKCFRVLNPKGFCGAEWDERLCIF